MGWWQDQVEKANKKDLKLFDQGLCKDLEEHLSSLSIESRMVIPGTSECIHKAMVKDQIEKMLHGCLKVDGQGFDFLDVVRRDWKRTPNWRFDAYSRSDLGLWTYGYVIRGRCPEAIESQPPKLVRLKVIGKGLNQQVMGLEWEGDGLAIRLNSDSKLRGMLELLDVGSPPLGVNSWSAHHDCWAMPHIYSSNKEDLVTIWLPVGDRRDFPSRNEIEIVNRICVHIRVSGSTASNRA